MKTSIKSKIIYSVILFGMFTFFVIYEFSDSHYLNKPTACPTIKEVYVREIITVQNDDDLDYCNLVKLSINKDSFSVSKLSCLDISEDLISNHGEVLVQLVDILGEDFFIQIAQKLNSIEKYRLYSFITIGLIETNLPQYQEKGSIKRFPKLLDYLVKNR